MHFEITSIKFNANEFIQVSTFSWCILFYFILFILLFFLKNKIQSSLIDIFVVQIENNEKIRIDIISVFRQRSISVSKTDEKTFPTVKSLLERVYVQTIDLHELLNTLGHIITYIRFIYSIYVE